MSLFGSLFSAFSGDSARNAAAAKEASLRQGYGDLSGLYGQGREAITGAYGQARQPLQQVFDESRGGSQAYADATGANGPEGLARARATFMSGQSGTNLQSQVGFGVDALARAGAAKGVATGNTLRDAEDYGQKVYGQGYGQYTAGLNPFLDSRMRSAAGLGQIGTSEGDSLSRSFMGQGNAAFDLGKGVGDTRAAGELADYGASQNLWSTLLGGGKALAGLYGAGALGKPGGFDSANPGAGVPRQGTGLFSIFS